MPCSSVLLTRPSTIVRDCQFLDIWKTSRAALALQLSSALWPLVEWDRTTGEWRATRLMEAMKGSSSMLMMKSPSLPTCSPGGGGGRAGLQLHMCRRAAASRRQSRLDALCNYLQPCTKALPVRLLHFFSQFISSVLCCVLCCLCWCHY